ncbi:oxidative stress-induced growth inhibitor 1-like isoform X2 [Epargyreus clarus]
MVTSFMLAGNVPHLKQLPEDLPIDEMLRARLSNLPPGQSLYETDLIELAEGLEGRSQNPIPLLVDNLLRPCADLGIQADSLIEWKYDVEKQIDHVVLGRGPPGGAWHTFPAGVRTLSPAGWLALPPHSSASSAPTARLPARAVAAYCRRYVHACGLQRFFRSGVIVSSVTLAPRGPPPCAPACPRNALFCVSGYDKTECRPFRYVCRRVVLAAGAGDRPNSLPPHLAAKSLHSLAAVQRGLQLLARHPGNKPPSVLVVGSGVSAADAVRLARSAALDVRHVHRTPADALARLSPQAYPDYCHVYKMMIDGPTGNYQNYTPYPEHMIVEITPVPGSKDTHINEKETSLRLKRVKLLNLITNETVEITVCLIAVLIGSKPDLFFLQTNFNINNMDIKNCIKCIDEDEKRKIEDENQRQCFLKNHWHYIKAVLGQSIQSCKSRYLNYTEINGNTNTKCIVPDCNKRNGITKIGSSDNVGLLEKCECEEKSNVCQCQPTNPYSSGIGFGIDPKKPVDGRSNPIAIDKSTHELLNAPKGMYALGPLTADNFIRFIPGGALALVAHIHKESKMTAE